MKKARSTQKSSPSSTAKTVSYKKISLSYLENSGAFYLGRFSASEQQFRQVMERKISRSLTSHPEQDKSECLQLLEQVIIKFRGLGYLNDAAYAQGLVVSLRARGFSSRRIAGTLAQKGIEGDLIESLLPPDTQEESVSLAMNWIKRKRLGPFSRSPDDPSTLNKALSSLARAGFSYDIARKALESAKDLIDQSHD